MYVKECVFVLVCVRVRDRDIMFERNDEHGEKERDSVCIIKIVFECEREGDKESACESERSNKISHFLCSRSSHNDDDSKSVVAVVFHPRSKF